MSFADLALVFAVIATIALIALVVERPRLLENRGGKALAFLALCLLPVGALGLGAYSHLESSKRTEFCLSCHVMEPYGESLRLDDSEALPASHYQNRRIDQETACFTCHTSYAMFGDVEAKMKGLKHLWVNYVGEIPEKIELYDPYSNRECLHCHSGARAFEESELHLDIRAELADGTTSCLECHATSHEAARVHELPKWEGVR